MEKIFHEDGGEEGSFGSSRDLRRGARVGTLSRWSSRESTRRIPGDSFGCCAISLRSRGEEERVRHVSGGYARHADMARKAFERDLRDTTAGRSSVGLDRRVGGERRRAHAPDLVFVGFFDLFVRRVRLELGVGHVACRS